MNKLCFLLFISFSISIKTYAQFDFGYDSVLQQKFNFQVKQLSQFFDRFNYHEHLKFMDNSKVSREKNLVSLINLKDKSLTTDSNIVTFINSVCSKKEPIYINYSDSNWFAICHCDFIYKDKFFNIDVVLKPERSIGNGYRWVIVNVLSNLFSFAKKESIASVFINPKNHEVGFTELSRAINEKNNITSYTSLIYSPSNLSVFLWLVQNGELKIKTINSIDFSFFQIESWTFTVKNFNRQDYNSGWLIASIKHMGTLDKNAYINTLYK